MNPILNTISFFGIFALCFIAWLGSEDKKRIPWKLMFWGIGIQLLLGFFIFIFPITREAIVVANDVLNLLLDASESGARFLFGDAMVPVKEKARADVPNMGFVFAMRSLPQVVFFSALVTLAYRLNIIQPVVRLFARFFSRTLKISGAESLSGAANIFVGIESVVSIRPYLEKMTRSEICAILASCFGSISSTVLGFYASILKPSFPNITGHLVASSILTIPACFVIAKILVPETGVPETMGKIPEEEKSEEEKKMSPMDALIKGAIDGVQIAMGIAAVLVAILGIVAFINLIFAKLALFEKSPNVLVHGIGVIFSYLTLDNIFAFLFFPLTFLTGVSLDFQELWQASSIIGSRLLQTSIPGFNALHALSSAGKITDRSLLIVSYVLSGFAHLASVGIFVGGMTNLVPSRSRDISSLAFKALWAATLATVMTGCIAGLFDTGHPSILGKIAR